MKTAILCLSALLCIAGAARADSALLGRWLEGLPMDPGVLLELDRFSRDEGDWPDGSEERLASMLRDRLIADVARAAARIEAGRHEEFVRVSYLEPRDFTRDGRETSDKRGREFEEGVIRTEQIALFPGVTIAPELALHQFVDPGFRKETSSRIEEINEEDGLSCIRTSGIWALLDPTSSCNRLDVLSSETVAAEHSQVVSNPGGKDFQPVYFKESVKAFFATEDGLVLYYINYARSAKLGSFKKKMGRGKIEESQRERAVALREVLGKQGD